MLAQHYHHPHHRCLHSRYGRHLPPPPSAEEEEEEEEEEEAFYTAIYASLAGQLISFFPAAPGMSQTRFRWNNMPT
jgi:hypothetical protein